MTAPGQPREAALGAGVTDTSFQALRPFAAEGLHSALYVVPVSGVLLGLVLFAASRTVARDMEKLQRWMRESTDQDEPPEITPAQKIAPTPAS